MVDTIKKDSKIVKKRHNDIIEDEIVRLILKSILKRKLNRTSYWRDYKKRIARYEVKFRKILKKYFKEQKISVVSSLKTYKSTYSGWSFDNNIWNERLQNEGLDFIIQLVKTEGSMILRRLRIIDQNIQSSFDVTDPKVAELIRQNVINFAQQVNDTTNTRIREVVALGTEAGEGIDQIADRIEDVFDEAIGYRSELIARTEVIRNSNMAAEESYKKSGVVESKEWYTTPDDALCEDCMELDGQVVELGESFSGGVDSPPLHCNCRCVILPVIKED